MYICWELIEILPSLYLSVSSLLSTVTTHVSVAVQRWGWCWGHGKVLVMQDGSDDLAGQVQRYSWQLLQEGRNCASEHCKAQKLCLAFKLYKAHWCCRIGGNSQIHACSFPYSDKFPFWINYLNYTIKKWLGQHFPETL